ncbi:MAG TPA: hypothetical protein VGQ06_02080, partial [Gemmatimonadales bacterium]|nr:hypothetical protein [Gemmatimonadales bacterium]
MLAAAFPANPHLGDAVIATFVWLGTTNIIDSVTDRLTNGTKVGNTYARVRYVQAGPISMATYVATNVQNFPDTSTDGAKRLVVQAHLSTSVQDGGIVISAYQGVNTVEALGGHSAAAGAGPYTTTTTAAPGAITVGAGELVYGVTLSNAFVGVDPPPPPFSRVAGLSDSLMKIDAQYLVQTAADTVNPRWNWFFTSERPGSWLATVLALKPTPGSPAPAPGPATHLAFTVQPSSTTAGSTMSPVKVAAQDDAGNTDANFTGSITVALNPNPSGGALFGTKTVTAVSGVATFSDLSIDKAGTGYTLQATATVTGATSGTFDIMAVPAAAPGIVFDTWIGTLGQSGTPDPCTSPCIVKGFNPRNPHLGDAIVATFFWVGTTNVIDSVTDFLTQTGTPRVGNKYTLVEYVHAANVSMATYVATNVQNFHDGSQAPDSILAVRANLRTAVTRGGVLLSAY